MSDEQHLSELIGLIYQAGTDAACVDDLAQKIASAFDSESSTILFCRDTQTGEARMPTIAGFWFATGNTDEKARMAYASYYHERNEWWIRGWKKGAPAIVLSQELIGPKEVLRTEWSDFLLMTDTFHLLGAQFIVAGDLLGVIGIHRPQKHDPFDEQDRQKMALLWPHIQRALQLRERLAMTEQRSALSLNVLDELTVGVILVAADCRILFVNRVAERVLRERQGLKVCKSRLQPLNSGEAHAFELAVSEAANASSGLKPSSGSTLCLALSCNAKLPVMVSPIKMGEAVFPLEISTAAVIFSQPNTNTIVTGQALARRYGLTAAEARLYSALIAGQELADYAGAQEIGISTVKTHLNNLFSKTGCHRQVDLVRNALSDPVLRLKLL